MPALQRHDTGRPRHRTPCSDGHQSPARPDAKSMKEPPSARPSTKSALDRRRREIQLLPASTQSELPARHARRRSNRRSRSDNARVATAGICSTVPASFSCTPPPTFVTSCLGKEGQGPKLRATRRGLPPIGPPAQTPDAQPNFRTRQPGPLVLARQTRTSRCSLLPLTNSPRA